jgi:hypothetical protein
VGLQSEIPPLIGVSHISRGHLILQDSSFDPSEADIEDCVDVDDFSDFICFSDNSMEFEDAIADRGSVEVAGR